MNKQTIKNILSIKSETTKRKTLWQIPISSRETIDKVNKKIWWVIRKSDFENLREYWIWEKELKKEIKIECKETVVSLLRVLSSISTWYIQNNLLEKFSNCWVALEFFLIDKLMRKNKKNHAINFEKWPLEFDAGKIDFLTKYNTNLGRIIIGNQLTTTESKWINTKYNDVREAWIRLDRQSWRIKDKTFSSNQIPHIPSLFIINSHTSREVNKGVNGNNNILKQAYIQWKKWGFKTWWPSQYLEKEIQDELNIIGVSYPKIVTEFINFVQKNNLEKPHMYIIKYRDSIIHMKYDSENAEFEWSFFKEKKWWEEFIYSVKFYITNKFLRVLNIPKNIIRKSNEDKKKKKTTPKKNKGNWWFYRPTYKKR